MSPGSTRKPSVPSRHDVGHAAHAGRDDRRAGGERLDRADGRALVHRRKEERVEQPVVPRDLLLVADEVRRARDAEVVRELLEALAIGAVSDHAEHRVDAALPRSRRTISRTAPVAFTPVIRPTQPTTNASFGIPYRSAVVEIRRLVAEPLVERDAEPDHRELVRGRDPVLHELVPDLRAHRDENVGAAREVALDLPEERGAARTEVALQHVPVERVDDDRRSRGPGDERGGACERACLGGVRVQDVRPLLRMIAVSRRTDLASCSSATSRCISGTSTTDTPSRSAT